jgi:hypothetical protein
LQKFSKNHKWDTDAKELPKNLARQKFKKTISIAAKKPTGCPKKMAKNFAVLAKKFLHGDKGIYMLPEELDSVPRLIVAGILQKRICF